jgi:hypothetical protein
VAGRSGGRAGLAVVPGQVVAMTGTERDRYRTLTASAVLLVAAIAAVISTSMWSRWPSATASPHWPPTCCPCPSTAWWPSPAWSCSGQPDRRLGTVAGPDRARPGGDRHPGLQRRLRRGTRLARCPAVGLASGGVRGGRRDRDHPAGLNGHADRAAELFAEDLAAGQIPGVRRIRKEMKVG